MRIVFINRLMGIRFGGGENADLNFARRLLLRGEDVSLIVGREWMRLRCSVDEFPADRLSYVRTPYLRNLHYKYCHSRNPVLKKVVSEWIGLSLDWTLFELATKALICRDDIRADWFQLCASPRLAGWIERSGRGRAAVRWPGPVTQRRAIARLNSYSLNWGPGKAYESLTPHDCRAANIPNGVDAERFERRSGLPANGRRPGWGGDSVVFLFAGRLIPVKNVAMLIRAFALAAVHSSRVRLLVVGEGEEEGCLRALAKKFHLGETIQFAGFLTGRDLVAAYHSVDVFCITSHYENFSFAVLEAMMASLPVIATRVGYLPSLVADGTNGIIVSPDNAEELSRAMLRLAGDESLRRRIGETNHRKVLQCYTWDNSVSRLLAAYKDCHQPSCPNELPAA